MHHKVMIVEDNPEARTLLSKLLISKGYCVSTAENGLEALTLLRQGVIPDIIVLDMIMPVMNGAEFATAAARDPVFSQIPLMVISAAEIHPLSRVRPTLTKPFLLEQFMEMVESILARKEQKAQSKAIAG